MLTSRQEGKSQSHDVDSELKLQKLANVVKDRSSPHHSFHNRATIENERTNC